MVALALPCVPLQNETILMSARNASSQPSDSCRRRPYRMIGHLQHRFPLTPAVRQAVIHLDFPLKAKNDGLIDSEKSGCNAEGGLSSSCAAG
jgi:hypothetical protein